MEVIVCEYQINKVMRKTRSTTLILLLGLCVNLTFSQDEYFQTQTGLPGDNLNLSAVLDLFKEAKNIEQFEKDLNSEDQKVNNLDLDGDGKIDYIRVEDHAQDEVHAIALQVPVSEDEVQDIAVIEIEKTGEGEAILQIVGDEDIYGESWIVEPFEEENTGNGPMFDEDVIRLVVNVWTWPTVRFIYRPSYRPWISPWSYRIYPRWWHPWRPFSWTVYRGYHRNFHLHYHVAPHHRVVRAHRVYVPRRRVSVTVQARHRSNINAYRTRPTVARRGAFQSSKTVTRVGPNGGSISATKTKKVGAVKGSGGKKAIGSKTSTSIKASGPGGQSVTHQRSAKRVATTNGRTTRAAGVNTKRTVRKQTTKKQKVVSRRGQGAVKKSGTRKVR